MKEINLMTGNNLYFLIGNRRASIGSETFITSAIPHDSKAGIGDEIKVEKLGLRVDSIAEEKVMGGVSKKYCDHIFQKLICTVIKIYE